MFDSTLTALWGVCPSRGDSCCTSTAQHKHILTIVLCQRLEFAEVFHKKLLLTWLLRLNLNGNNETSFSTLYKRHASYSRSIGMSRCSSFQESRIGSNQNNLQRIFSLDLGRSQQRSTHNINTWPKNQFRSRRRRRRKSFITNSFLESITLNIQTRLLIHLSKV